MLSVARRRQAARCALALACTLPLLASAQSMLKVGERISGEITSGSRLNYSDGSRSNTYVLALARDEAVVLRTEGALCARLAVFEQGALLADSFRSSMEGCEGGNGSSHLSFRAPADGRYEVAVSGIGPRAYGPYRLQVEPLQAYAGGPLAAGSRFIDLLRPGVGNEYVLEVPALGQYVIDLRSSEFDPVLVLAGNEVQMEDDDGGSGLDARIRVLLEPGRYTLGARSVDREANGAFELEVRQQPLPEGTELRNGGALEADGAAITGSIAGSARTYELVLDQRRLVTVDLASEDYDAYLEISGSQARVRDDDSAGEGNSRIIAVLDPGTYTVHAGSLGSGSGVFTLSASTAPAPAGKPASLAVGGSANGELVVAGKDRYLVNITRAGTYRFQASGSSRLDLMLDLVQGGQRLDDDDDSAGGNDPAIEAELAPGRYEVVVSAWSRGAGRYRLSASRVR